MLIAGGGLVGLTLACLLAQSGRAAAVVDAREPEAGLDAGFDGRASAIAAGSVRILERAGAWAALGDAEARLAAGPSEYYSCIAPTSDTASGKYT